MRHKQSNKPFYEKLIHEINEKAAKLAIAFRIQAPEKLTVKMKSKKAFKILPFSGGEEFVFSHIYVGKKMQWIFCFRPMSSETYEHVEIDEEKVFETFPLTVDLLKDIEAFSKIEDATQPYVFFMAQRNIYCNNQAKLKVSEEQAEEMRQKIEKEQELKPYLDNELFGMFG